VGVVEDIADFITVAVTALMDVCGIAASFNIISC
jgi:hypothetical protein